MSLTEFLAKHARVRFRTISDLAKLAKEEGLLKKSQPLKDFVPLLENWMKANPQAFYAELYMAGQGRLKARCNGKNIGLIRVIRAHLPGERERMKKKVHACLNAHGLAPTAYVVSFQYDEQGEEPEAITKAYHEGLAMGLDVQREYGALIFKVK